jgi:hypothetical protein
MVKEIYIFFFSIDMLWAYTLMKEVVVSVL